jgi:Flp pilus assembly protein TadG
MQRLTDLFRGRLSDERGATAVVFALILIPVLGFAALAVDIGSLYAERARLQVAADAAAIAVAQDCSRGTCGDMLATARAMVVANDGDASAAQPVLNSAPLSVTVAGRTPVKHWFAPVIGHDATAVSASATVGWGAPSQGTAVMPLTFSWCEFAQQTGGGLPSGSTARTIYFTKTSNTTGCTGPSHNIVPGGFAYLDTDPGKCAASTGLGGQWMSSTGNSVPSACSTADLSKWVGQTVLLPIFDQSGDTGSNAWYRVYGYAAFKVTGYSLGGQFTTSPKPCTGNDRCVSGYFTRFVELSDAWNYSPDAPTLGASVLRLIR